MKKALTFDDVLLVPQYSEIEHRFDVDISTKILPSLELKSPFISANMDTITGPKMILAMNELGCLGILHRSSKHCIRNIIDTTKLGKYTKSLVISIGLNNDFLIADAFKNHIRYLCIDVAHGHHIGVKKLIDRIRAAYHGHFEIIAGNVCTYEGARDLFKWGADCVKVGIGPGSVCSTRIKTGCGYPQFSAIMEAHKARQTCKDIYFKNKFIIADGGIKNYGDITKALAAGADAVMMGGMFAGCKETPAHRWRTNSNSLKVAYRGMASIDAQQDQGIEDPYEEGVSLGVDYKGSVKHIIGQMGKALRSGLSYCGARSIEELRQKHEFVEITHNASREGEPHYDH